MADRYDPKGSSRPSSAGRPAEPRRSEPEEDPLTELARIVQGRPASSSASTKGRGTTGNDQQRPAANAVSDLEAELLNDLQASFAAVREAAGPLPPSPPTAPPVRAERPERPEPEMPRVAAPSIADTFAPLPPFGGEEEFVEEQEEPAPEETPAMPRFVPIPPAPVMQPPPAQRATEPVVDRAPPRPAAKVAQAPEPKVDARPDLGSFQLRPSTPANQSSSRQPHSRWEKPEPQKPQASGGSRFAPPKAATPQSAPSFDDLDDELDPFAEGGVFAQNAEPDADGEFPMDAFEGAASEEDQFPPLDEGDTLTRPRRNRTMILIAGVAAIAIVGGTAFALLRPSETTTGTPQIVTADNGPTKITPEDNAATTDADPQNKLIYDRINAAGAETNPDTTLVTPGDQAIADVPTTNDTTSPISRVIIPGGPGIDAPQTDDALRLDEQPGAVTPPVADAPAADAGTQVASNDATADPDALQAIGPRKVRTVVVKPDGTIVSSAATDATAAPPAKTTGTATAPSTTADATPPPAAATAPAPDVRPVDDTQAIAGTTQKELPITTAPDTATADTAVVATEPLPPAVVAQSEPTPSPPVVAVVPKPVVKPPTKVTTTTIASNSAPMDLSSAAPPAASTSGGSGMVVQISSQRSEDAARATYRDLQARYPRILGNYNVNIQRIEIADRGVFFRVRVGPFSPGDAQRLCDDLKSAGGDCVLAKR